MQDITGTEDLARIERGDGNPSVETLWRVSQAQVGPDGQEAELGAGDAAWFTADVAHHYAGLRDARVLCWMIYPGEA